MPASPAPRNQLTLAGRRTLPPSLRYGGQSLLALLDLLLSMTAISPQTWMINIDSALASCTDEMSWPQPSSCLSSPEHYVALIGVARPYISPF
jgi:hypothetical protein